MTPPLEARLREAGRKAGIALLLLLACLGSAALAMAAEKAASVWLPGSLLVIAFLTGVAALLVGTIAFVRLLTGPPGSAPAPGVPAESFVTMPFDRKLEWGLSSSPRWFFYTFALQASAAVGAAPFGVAATLLALCWVPALLFLLLVRSADLYEPEPFDLVLRTFCWGAGLGVLWAGPLNDFARGFLHGLTLSDADALAGTAVLAAPVVEEILKGLAILAILHVRPLAIDSVVDGVVYGASVALGFAAAENVDYLLAAYAENGFEGLVARWFARVVLLGWSHPFFTAFTGAALAADQVSRRTRIAGLPLPLAGLATAAALHAGHNLLSVLANTREWAGWMLVIASWTAWLAGLALLTLSLRNEGRLIRNGLAEEVASGLLSAEQARRAGSAFARAAAELRALGSGRYAAAAGLHLACAALALKKRQLAVVGLDEGRRAEIDRLRGEIARLAA